MKILFSHIQEHIKKDIDISSVSKTLFMLGHENEYYDGILDIEFTPNRGDCLSVYGLVRDLNSIYETDLTKDIYKGEINDLDFNFTNKKTDFCPKVSFLKIEIENTTDKYKPYLEDYFTDLKITKNNFFTDISNYLAYEIGQPTHCYDFNKVKEGICLESTTCKSSFKTLLEKDIELKPGEIVFKKNDEIINLAGVMGGYSTKCDNSSNIALVECAYFCPDMIMGKSTKYDLVSDAAYKFERGTDINMHDFALRRFINIVKDHVKIKSFSVKSESSYIFENKEIECDYVRINNILGTNLKEEFIDNILYSLGFKKNTNFVIPSWRSDIELINDLAEEIARVIGYDEIKASNLDISRKIIKKSTNSSTNRIRNYLISKGFNEVINDPFDSKNKTGSIAVDNALDSNRSFLRLKIINSLIKNLDYNEKRQKEVIKFFEISDIYSVDKDNKIHNQKYISIIVSGRQGLNYKDFNKRIDENYLEQVVKKLGLDLTDIKEIDRSSFNSKLKNKIFYIECEVDKIDLSLLNNEYSLPNKNLFKKFSPISDFPASNRDISISLDNELILDKVVNLLFNINLLNLEDLFIFDFYHNKDKNIMKVGFRFIFQSNEKTLVEADVDEEMEKVFAAVIEIDGADVPGLDLR